MKSILAPFVLLFSYRKMILHTTMSDIKGRFAGSVFGLLWLLFYPLLLLATYSFVYIYVFKVRFGIFNSTDYVLLIFSGLIPFLGFTEGIATGIPSITANSALVKNTLFPIDIIPVKSILYSQCTQVAGLFLLIGALIFTNKITLYVLWLVPIWILQILLTIGLIWILSSLNVYFRDMQNFVTIITIFLMMVSPIAYTIDMIPANLQAYIKWNPLYYMIMAYQDCLINGRDPRIDIMLTLVVISISAFIIGYWFFCKLKSLFADNI